MSQTRIVNRITSPGLEREAELLRQADEAAGIKPEPAQAERAPVEQIPVPSQFRTKVDSALYTRKTVDGEVITSEEITRAEKLIDQAIDVLVEQAVTELASPENIEKYRAAKFRENVIAAFKHLGLDTVKFFGELEG